MLALTSVTLDVLLGIAELTAESSSREILVDASALLVSLKLIESRHGLRAGCCLLLADDNICIFIFFQSTVDELSCLVLQRHVRHWVKAQTIAGI